MFIDADWDWFMHFLWFWLTLIDGEWFWLVFNNADADTFDVNVDADAANSDFADADAADADASNYTRLLHQRVLRRNVQ